MMGEHTCGRTWYSAPTPISMETIKEVRTALEHGRIVLAANALEFVALDTVGERFKQCKANRTGAVIAASVIDASSSALRTRVKNDGEIFMAKSAHYCHKKLFTVDRVLIVPFRMDWQSCVPWNLRKSPNVPGVKEAKLAAKAVFWTSFGTSIRKYPKLAGFSLMISAFYILRMVGVSPIRFAGLISVFIIDSAGEVLGVDSWSWDGWQSWWDEGSLLRMLLRVAYLIKELRPWFLLHARIVSHHRSPCSYKNLKIQPRQRRNQSAFGSRSRFLPHVALNLLAWIA